MSETANATKKFPLYCSKTDRGHIEKDIVEQRSPCSPKGIAELYLCKDLHLLLGSDNGKVDVSPFECDALGHGTSDKSKFPFLSYETFS